MAICLFIGQFKENPHKLVDNFLILKTSIQQLNENNKCSNVKQMSVNI